MDGGKLEKIRSGDLVWYSQASMVSFILIGGNGYSLFTRSCQIHFKLVLIFLCCVDNVVNINYHYEKKKKSLTKT